MAAVGASIAGTAVIVAVLVWSDPAREEERDPCPPDVARIDPIWGGARREAVRAAFARTQLPYAERTAQLVGATLDDYRARWLELDAGLCRARLSAEPPSEELLARRTRCLDRRLSQLRELTQLWIEGTDERALKSASVAARDLPRLDECERADALLALAPLPGEPAAVAAIESIEVRLDRATAMVSAKREREARALLLSIVDEADRTGWPHVRAEARYVAGLVEAHLEHAMARTHLEQANLLAAEARDERLAAAALVELTAYVSRAEGADRVGAIAAMADAAIDRAGNDARLRAAMLFHRGDAHNVAGRSDEAKRAFLQAREAAVAGFGADSYLATGCTLRLVHIAREQRRADEMRALAREAVTGLVRILGPQHPVAVAIGEEFEVPASSVGP